jgi:ferrochelatase
MAESRRIRKLAVVCPSFVADCLETLEEVQMRGKEEFVYHGGEELDLIPCVNSEAVWVEGLKRIIESAS